MTKKGSTIVIIIIIVACLICSSITGGLVWFFREDIFGTEDTKSPSPGPSKTSGPRAPGGTPTVGGGTPTVGGGTPTVGGGTPVSVYPFIGKTYFNGITTSLVIPTSNRLRICTIPFIGLPTTVPFTEYSYNAPTLRAGGEEYTYNEEGDFFIDSMRLRYNVNSTKACGLRM